MKRRNFIGSLAALLATPVLGKLEIADKFTLVVAPVEDRQSFEADVMSEMADMVGNDVDQMFLDTAVSGEPPIHHNCRSVSVSLREPVPETAEWHSVAYGDGVFVAVGSNRSMKSTDMGLTWDVTEYRPTWVEEK